MDEGTQKKIDSLIFETSDKLASIAGELKDIKFSKLDDKTKNEKMDFLRNEFEKVLKEEQKKVEEIVKRGRQPK